MKPPVLGRDYKVRESRCPCCGKLLDGATSVNASDENPPEPGNVTVCIRCINWLCFEDDLALRELTEDEIAELPTEVFDLLSIISRGIAETQKHFKAKQEEK